MSGARITKLVCPACDGTGATHIFVGYSWSTMRCVMRTPSTRSPAVDTSPAIMTSTHCRKMEREAEVIYSVARVSPPWKAVQA